MLSYTSAAAVRIRRDKCQIPPAIPQAKNKPFGLLRGQAASLNESMPGIRLIFRRAEPSLTSRTARSGLLLWMAPRSRTSSSCAARISSRIGHRTAASSLSFPRAAITVSSASTTLPRNPFLSSHPPWIPTAALSGHSTASVSRLCASRRRSAMPHKVTSLLRTSRTPGPFGLPTQPHAPQKKSGAAATNPRIRFRIWRTAPAAASLTGLRTTRSS